MAGSDSPSCLLGFHPPCTCCFVSTSASCISSHRSVLRSHRVLCFPPSLSASLRDRRYGASLCLVVPRPWSLSVPRALFQTRLSCIYHCDDRECNAQMASNALLCVPVFCAHSREQSIYMLVSFRPLCLFCLCVVLVWILSAFSRTFSDRSFSSEPRCPFGWLSSFGHCGLSPSLGHSLPRTLQARNSALLLDSEIALRRLQRFACCCSQCVRSALS
jgi:hypothetical protein